MSRKIKILPGEKYGRLTVIEEVDPTYAKNGKAQRMFKFLCDCGNYCVKNIVAVRFGSIRSCGCLVKEGTGIVHGKSGSKEHLAWLRIKQRCYDSNRENFEYYGGRGILMSDEFKNDFMAFFNEIGEYPKDGNKYTVERIDNNKGYEKANIKWELFDKQARNKRKSKNNSSGFTGVHLTVTKTSVGYSATWMQDGVDKAKYFSALKYGIIPAFAMACKYREEKIKELNDLGYGYTDNHGK